MRPYKSYVLKWTWESGTTNYFDRTEDYHQALAHLKAAKLNPAVKKVELIRTTHIDKVVKIYKKPK